MGIRAMIAQACCALTLIAAAAWVFPAAAAEAAPSTVEACVRGAGNRTAAREACIGRVATACIGPDEGARSDGFIRDCFNSEQQQWDRLLNVAYKTLIQGLEPDRQAKLREMQRAWIDSRERTCNFYYDYFQGSMAYPMIANCMNLETARRAVFLMDIADDFRDRVKQ